MIDLWYLNTQSVGPENVQSLVKLLPPGMASEISRFRNHEDRRLKLFGRLMTRKYYTEQGRDFDWLAWQTSAGGKPYYRNGSKKFSISHSGDYVAVAFSDEEVGTDIEKLTAFDLMAVSGYLHPLERAFIENTSDREDAFFSIWTRKEAYLKATGQGIVNGLDNENCLADELISKEKWFLHSLSLFYGYRMAVCTPVPDCRINTRELSQTEFQV